MTYFFLHPSSLGRNLQSLLWFELLIPPQETSLFPSVLRRSTVTFTTTVCNQASVSSSYI